MEDETELCKKILIYKLLVSELKWDIWLQRPRRSQMLQLRQRMNVGPLNYIQLWKVHEGSFSSPK